MKVFMAESIEVVGGQCVFSRVVKERRKQKMAATVVHGGLRL